MHTLFRCPLPTIINDIIMNRLVLTICALCCFLVVGCEPNEPIITCLDGDFWDYRGKQKKQADNKTFMMVLRLAYTDASVSDVLYGAGPENESFTFDGGSDFYIITYRLEGDKLFIYKADDNSRILMEGVFSEEDKKLTLSWSGSLGPLWDRYAEDYGWESSIILTTHYPPRINR